MGKFITKEERFPDGIAGPSRCPSGGGNDLQFHIQQVGATRLADIVGQERSLLVKGDAGVTVESPNVEITGGNAKIGGTVSPSGQGALCGIPACLFTGAPHVGDTAAGT